ncbi:hypothetical protein GC175_22605 [bacterium]|nr:hypothetical protein [bacterium]
MISVHSLSSIHPQETAQLMQPSVATMAQSAAAMALRVQPGVNIDPKNPWQGNPNPAHLLDAGVRWVRFVFKNKADEELENDFNFFETVVDQLRQVGIDVLMVINNESCPGRPTWHEHNRDRAAWQRLSVWQPYLDKFTARCRTIAARFEGRVAVFQIWNEPDHPPMDGYDPTADPQIYGPMLRMAYQAIKGVSDVTVITAGFVSGNPDWPREVIAASGGVLYADAIAVHPYVKRPHPEDHPKWGNTGVQYELLQQYLSRYAKPIWVTELGTHNADPEVQGNFPRRAFEAINETLRRNVPVAFWFCWSNGMVKPHGMVQENGAPTHSYVSFQAYAKQAAAAPVGTALPATGMAAMASPAALEGSSLTATVMWGAAAGNSAANGNVARYSGWSGTQDDGQAQVPPSADAGINQADLMAFGAQVRRAQVTPGTLYWKIVEARHASPNTEFGGDQHVYVEAVDENGHKLRQITMQVIENGVVKHKTLDKHTNQPGADWPIWQGSRVSVSMTDLPSDEVQGLHTNHPAYKGGDFHHHAWYVVFQKTVAGGSVAQPSTSTDEIRRQLWSQLAQTPFQEDGLVEHARRHDLGAPVTPRQTIGAIVAQGFARGIVIIQADGVIEHISW